MKKRLLYIVLAAALTAVLVLTAAAAEPAPGDGPTGAGEPVPVLDPTTVPADAVDEAPDGPAAEPTAEPTAVPTAEPADVLPEEPAEDPADEPTVEPTEEPADVPSDELPAPANIAADEPVPVAAEESNVPYVDANGGALTCPSATVVEEEAVEWAEGWYVAKGTVTVPERVKVTGKVNLILADGCSLTVIGGIQVFAGNSLTIWGQAGGTGKLTADGSSIGGGWCAGIGGNANDPDTRVGAIEINGGVIAAIGGPANAGIGSYKSFERITINGGTVTASGHVGIGSRGVDSAGGPIAINGGTVTATGGGNNDGVSVGIGGNVESVTITGGTVSATGGPASAGIGSSGGGAIAITGGTVSATGGAFTADYTYGSAGAGISSTGGAITVKGGTVTAQGGDGGVGSGGAGIAGPSAVSGGNVTANGGTNDAGSVYYGITGRFSTGSGGNGVVYSNGIADKSGQGGWSGVIFEGNEGQVYGHPAPTESFAVKEGQTLTVPGTSFLGVREGVTLTNDGTIQNQGGIDIWKGEGIEGDGKIYGIPVNGYELALYVPDFGKAKYGSAPPAAQAVTIENLGSNAEHISKVELTGDTDAFEFAGSFTGELTPKSSNESWTIRPKAGLSAGGWFKSYTATVSVTYDFGCTATKEVSFTVELADGEGAVTMEDYTCGDDSVTPQAYSETNKDILGVTYAVKGSDEYGDKKPSAPGEYTVRVVFKDSENYRGPAVTADFKVTHQLNGGWEEQPDGGHHTCGCGTELLLKADALTEVPDGLKDKYDSAEELTRVLAQAVDTGENYAVYDVKLEERRTGGDWMPVPEEELPAAGLAVTLPYPQGTDAGYTFTAVHMFEGEKAGRTEKPAVKNDAGGVTFTVTGLSPVCIGWRATAAAAAPGATSSPAATVPYTGDESPLLPWTAALCLAGAALGMLLLRRRRRG